MSNDYYNHGSVPATGSSLSSATMRAEFDAIATGMDKLPPLTGNNNEVVVVNAGATGQSSVPRAALIDTTIVDAADKATPVDADLLPLVDSAAANVLKKLTWANLKATLKTYFDSVTTTLTNKTLTSPVISGGTINGATVGATSPNTGAFTTLSATGSAAVGTSTISGSSASGSATVLTVRDTANNNLASLRLMATAVNGYEVYSAGTSLNFYDVANSAVRGTFSSTGLAVTGALSATGSIGTVQTTSTGNRLSFTRNGANYINSSGASSSINYAAPAHTFYAADEVTTYGTFSGTGLAVTGALSATGDGTLGSAGNNAKLALGNQSGSYYGYVHQDAAVTGKMRYNSYAVAGTTHGHQWEINGSSVAVIDSAGNLGLGVTPSAWQTSHKALQFTHGAIASGSGLGTVVTANAFYNVGAAWTYQNTAGAMRYTQDGAGHYWHTAPSGTAGNAITFTQAMDLDSTALTGGADNVRNLGSGAKRWATVYAGTGTINTSDAREKTEVATLTAAEIKAAKQLSKEVGTYKFLASIQAKGDAARTHIGMTVQRAIEIMEANGLDPFDYGFICHDVWEDEFVEHPATEESAAWTEQTQVAGDRYAFRYDQLNLFIAAGIEARLTALENANA